MDDDALLDAPDALADALGEVVADLRDQWQREMRLLAAESAAIVSGLRCEIAELKAAFSERANTEFARIPAALALVKDGEPGRSVTLDDARPVIEAEIVRQFDAAPKPPDEAAIEARIAAEIDRRLDDIARRAVDLTPRPEPVELPDVGAAVAVEFAKREGALVERAAALVEIPDPLPLPDIDAKVDHAVGAAFATVRVPKDGVDADPAVTADLVRDEMEKAVTVLRAEMPEPGEIRAIVGIEVCRLLEAQTAGLTIADLQPVIAEEFTRQFEVAPKAPSADEINALAEAAAETAVDRRVSDIAQRAADLVPRVEPPELPDVATLAERAAALIPRPEDGKTPSVDDIRPVVAAEVRAAIAELPKPEPGPPGERGLDGVPGKLPIVRSWTDGVHYEGDVRAHAGATWQAVRDTGREPPHEDWICLAASGRDGVDGRSFTVRGTYSEVSEYHALDIVTLNGGSFIARRDDPGPCPGEGWQLTASQGKQGKPGDRGAPGPKGDRGVPGPAVVGITIDGDGMQTFVNGDGSTVVCDLYPLLEKIDR